MINAQVSFIEVTSSEEMVDVRAKARELDRMLFVDVYATWCGPCKIMDRDVYTDAGVAAYMNTHFVNVRMDGETEFGREYAMEMKLQGYPSMFVFSPEGEPVSRIIGFTAAEELVRSLQDSRKNYAVVEEYRDNLGSGVLEEGEYALYIEAVRNMGNEEQAERLASEYMVQNVGTRLSDSDIRVVAYYTDLDDKWWQEFSGNQERLRDVLGDEYTLTVEKIYNNTLVKAVEENDLKLISRLSNELTPLFEDDEVSAWDLRTLPFLQFYYYTDRLEELTGYVDSRFAADKKGDHRWLYHAASQITEMDRQYMTEELLAKAVEWYRTCIELEEHFDYYFYHGMMLYFLQRRDEAKESFLEARNLASEEDEQNMVNEVLGYLGE